MTSRFALVLSFCLATVSPLSAQIDIYQSNAYSPEEVCARQAEQAGTDRYNDAYEQCLTAQHKSREQREDGGEDGIEEMASIEDEEDIDDTKGVDDSGNGVRHD